MPSIRPSSSGSSAWASISPASSRAAVFSDIRPAFLAAVMTMVPVSSSVIVAVTRSTSSWASSTTSTSCSGSI